MTDYPTGDNESAVNPHGSGEGLDNPSWEGDNVDPNGMTTEEQLELTGVLTRMAAAGDDNRRGSDLYQQIAAKPNLESRLRFAYNHINQLKITLTQVMVEVDGVEMTSRKFEMIEFLDSMADEVTDLYAKEEGAALSRDKAYQYMARNFRLSVEEEALKLARAKEDTNAEEDVPFLAVANSEPLPDHLPESLKIVLRLSRTAAGYDDDGNKIG